MIRKFTAMVLLFGAAMFSGCKNDVDDLWDAYGDLEDRVATLETKVTQINTDITTLNTMMDAISRQVQITSVYNTDALCIITFSDGRTCEIQKGVNGQDGSAGKDGKDAPTISVKQDSDGIYYWTLDGEYMIVDGNKVAAQGTNGQDAVAPQVRINATNGEWEISTDGGTTWASTGVKATGAAGDSLFKDVKVEDDKVTITLSDDTQFTLNMVDESLPSLTVTTEDASYEFTAGEVKTYAVTLNHVSMYSIAKPDGWKVLISEGTMSITAPVAENSFAELSGEIAITLISSTGRSSIVKISVSIKD